MSTFGDCCHTLSESTDYIRNRSDRGDTVWNSNILHKKLERELACFEDIKEQLPLDHPVSKYQWGWGGHTEGPVQPLCLLGSILLLVLHHLFIGRWRCVAVGRRRWVGCASVRWIGLDLESHRHGIANRIHPGSSRVSVIWRPHLLCSWKTRYPYVSTKEKTPPFGTSPYYLAPCAPISHYTTVY